MGTRAKNLFLLFRDVESFWNDYWEEEYLSVPLYTQKSSNRRRNLFSSLPIRKNHRLCGDVARWREWRKGDPLFDLTLRSQLVSELDRKRARLRATKSVLLCAEGDKNTWYDGGGGGWTKYWIGWKFVEAVWSELGVVWSIYSYFILFDTKFEIF